MGAPQRCPLERLAASIPVVRHLLASLRRVVRQRCVGKSVAAIGPQAGPQRPNRLARRLRRRHVCLGKKRGDRIGKTRRGKGTKIMVLTDARGLPLAIEIEAANHAEVNLIEPLIDSAVTPYVPSKLIYDRAADSDPLRRRLAERNVELICPHRKGRVRPATQDGRKLRRYRRRWIIERTISWLHDFRRLIVRHEFYSYLFHGFLTLACLIIALRRL